MGFDYFFRAHLDANSFSKPIKVKISNIQDASLDTCRNIIGFIGGSVYLFNKITDICLDRMLLKIIILSAAE